MEVMGSLCNLFHKISLDCRSAWILSSLNVVDKVIQPEFPPDWSITVVIKAASLKHPVEYHTFKFIARC